MSETKFVKFHSQIEHGDGSKDEIAFKIPVAEASDQRVRDVYRQAADHAVAFIEKAATKAHEAKPAMGVTVPSAVRVDL